MAREAHEVEGGALSASDERGGGGAASGGWGEGDDGGDDGGYTDTAGAKVSPGETCVVCMYARSEVVYKECGHLVCCGVCAGRMDRCPLCRRRSAHMRVYRAGL